MVTRNDVKQKLEKDMIAYLRTNEVFNEGDMVTCNFSTLERECVRSIFPSDNGKIVMTYIRGDFYELMGESDYRRESKCETFKLNYYEVMIPKWTCIIDGSAIIAEKFIVKKMKQ